MQDYLNLHILHMFADTFSLDTAHLSLDIVYLKLKVFMVYTNFSIDRPVFFVFRFMGDFLKSCCREVGIRIKIKI